MIYFTVLKCYNDSGDKMKDIRLVALDLDDTTLRSDSALDPATKDALIKAIAAGIEVVVASGRAYRSLPDEILSIPGIRYAITSNGAAIERVPGGSRIMSRAVPEAAVHEILNAFPDVYMLEAFIDGQPYCVSEYIKDPLRYGCSKDYVNYVQSTRLPVEDMRAFILENASRLDSIDLICRNAEEKALYYDKAKEISGIYVTSSSPRLVEISDAGAGKGRALRYLCERLSVPSENLAAFGNGDNDADMLSFAGFGVAVGNATKACKDAADYICESNNELGVAKTLLKFI